MVGKEIGEHKIYKVALTPETQGSTIENADLSRG